MLTVARVAPYVETWTPSSKREKGVPSLALGVSTLPVLGFPAQFLAMQRVGPHQMTCCKALRRWILYRLGLDNHVGHPCPVLVYATCQLP